MLGAFIYVFFRNDVLFLSLLNINYRTLIRIEDSLIGNFLLNNLSDALWGLSIMFFVSSFPEPMLRICGLILPLIMELLQICAHIPGTFDLIDMIIYVTIDLIFFIKWKEQKEL